MSVRQAHSINGTRKKDTMIAEIVTTDGSLVQRFMIDRHSGRTRSID